MRGEGDGDVFISAASLTYLKTFCEVTTLVIFFFSIAQEWVKP